MPLPSPTHPHAPSVHLCSSPQAPFSDPRPGVRVKSREERRGDACLWLEGLFLALGRLAGGGGVAGRSDGPGVPAAVRVGELLLVRRLQDLERDSN